MSASVVKVTMNLPRSDVDDLRRMAERHGFTVTYTIRRAIAMERFIEGAISNGEKLLIEDQRGAIRQLVIR